MSDFANGFMTAFEFGLIGLGAMTAICLILVLTALLLRAFSVLFGLIGDLLR